MWRRCDFRAANSGVHDLVGDEQARVVSHRAGNGRENLDAIVIRPVVTVEQYLALGEVRVSE